MQGKLPSKILVSKIISNKIKCTKCGDVIESKTRWDMVWCSCQSVAVDGGHDYLRRLGVHYEELSENE